MQRKQFNNTFFRISVYLPTPIYLPSSLSEPKFSQKKLHNSPIEQDFPSQNHLKSRQRQHNKHFPLLHLTTYDRIPNNARNPRKIPVNPRLLPLLHPIFKQPNVPLPPNTPLLNPNLSTNLRIPPSIPTTPPPPNNNKDV